MNTEQAIVAIIAQDHIQQKPEFPLVLSKLILNDLKGLMGDKMEISEVERDRWHIKQLLNQLAFLMSQGVIESRHAKQILTDAWNTEPFAWDICWYLSDTKLLDETGGDELDVIILELFKFNEKVVQDIQKGKTKAAGSLIGPVLRAAGGKANPKEITERVLKLAQKSV